MPFRQRPPSWPQSVQHPQPLYQVRWSRSPCPSACLPPSGGIPSPHHIQDAAPHHPCEALLAASRREALCPSLSLWPESCWLWRTGDPSPQGKAKLVVLAGGSWDQSRYSRWGHGVTALFPDGHMGCLLVAAQSPQGWASGSRYRAAQAGALCGPGGSTLSLTSREVLRAALAASAGNPLAQLC